MEPRTRDLAELRSHLDHIRAAPSEQGTIELIVRRPEVEAREVLEQGELDPVVGLVGDCWQTRGSSVTSDGSASLDAQVTLMNARSADAVAIERGRWPLAGDQLYVDFDLSPLNLPPGTHLRAGEAELEVTSEPHLGCGKFIKRFGVDAMKFVNSEDGRAVNARGINTKVISGGAISTGDPIQKL